MISIVTTAASRSRAVALLLVLFISAILLMFSSGMRRLVGTSPADPWNLAAQNCSAGNDSASQCQAGFAHGPGERPEKRRARRLHQPLGDAVAALGIHELIREHDNHMLAPMFQGMALAPALTWRSLLFAAANVPVDDVDNRMLHLAARSGNCFYAWCLLENGADPALTNAGQQTALEAVPGFRTEMHTLVAESILHRLTSGHVSLSGMRPAETWASPINVPDMSPGSDDPDLPLQLFPGTAPASLLFLGTVTGL